MSDPYSRTPEGLFDRIFQRLKGLEDRGAAALPGRLRPEGDQVTDWNEVTAAGFYWSTNTAANRPSGSSYLSGIVYRNRMAGFERVVQEIVIPNVNDRRSASVKYVRVGWLNVSTWVWTAWRRSDGMMIPTSVVGGTFDGATARMNLTTGSKTWSMNGVFTADFRAYRILFQYYTGDTNGSWIKLRQNGTDHSATEYQYHTIYSSSGTVSGANGTSVPYFGLPSFGGSGHWGEIIVSEPMYTAGTANQKRMRSHIGTYGAYGQTHGACSLNGADTTAFDGFTLSLSNTGLNGVPATSQAWISVQGIA